MSFGQVALGLASIAIGLNHLNSGVKRLRGAPPPQIRYRRQLGDVPVTVPGRPFHSSGYKQVRAPNGATVPMQMRSFEIRSLEDRIHYLRRLVDAGKRDPQVFAFARRNLTRRCGNDWCIPEKHNLAEAKAIFGAIHDGRYGHAGSSERAELETARNLFRQIRRNVRYTSDIAGVDTYQKPGHTLALKTADCLPAGTKLLRADGKLISIEDVRVGDKVFDGVGWARVMNWWDKAIQPVMAYGLNNGCVLTCTDEHKVFRAPRLSPGGRRSVASAEEVCAKDLRPGDDLIQPSELVFENAISLSSDEAFLLGAYLSEGSVRHVRVDGAVATVEIAGVPNGKGIREQAIVCARRLGFRVSELDRQIYVSDSGDHLNKLVGGCGRYAPQKRLPHVNWTCETAEGLLLGLSADGGMSSNNANFVFSTTSPVLAVQYRLLQRLFGRSCSIKRVDDHGGFGTNPIYRVTVRTGGRKPFAKVKSISDGGEEHVFDIETDSHRFYLPEQDIVVHNCDDFSSLTCASLQSVGIPCRFKVIRTKGAREWNHIYPQAGFPRHAPTKWVSMDSSVNMPFGWEAPRTMVDASRVFRVG